MSRKQPDHPESRIAERVVAVCDAQIDRVGTCDGCPEYLGDEGRCRFAPADPEDVELEIDR